MKRRYRSAGYLERCRRLRSALDQPAFSTDVIVGFPGETEEDFEATCQVLCEVGFCKVHIFSYSPRQGTEAAHFTDLVPPAIVAHRRERLQLLERELADRFMIGLLGRRLDVLVEGPAPKRADSVLGTSCRSVQVILPGDFAALRYQVVPVRALLIDNGVIVGEPMNRKSAYPVTDALQRQQRIALDVLDTHMC